MNSKDICQEIFSQAIESVRADRLMDQYLSNHPAALPERPFYILGAGKAAAWMAEAICRFPGAEVKGGLIAVIEGHTRPRLPIKQIESGHPIPNKASLEAGAEIWRMASELPADMPVVGIITGGASALMEHLKPPHELRGLQEMTAQSMRQGEDIRQLNQRRREISLLKGGGLARQLGQRELQVFVLSDVIDGGPQVIGSGPFWTGNESAPHRMIGSWRNAAAAAEKAAQSLGFKPRVIPPLTDRDDRCAETLAEEIDRLQPGEAVIASGEPTVDVSGSGLGGRCQQIACRIARHIRGREDIAFLAAGTDGTDGPTDAAGAVVDGDSYHRAAARHVSYEETLARSSSYDWCEAAEAHVFTGPTGTNVNDLFLAVRAGSR